MKIYPKSRLDKTVKKIKYGLAGIFFQESILPTWWAAEGMPAVLAYPQK